MKHRANAQAALEAVATFEESHHKRAGAYTQDLRALGQVYGDPDQFLTLLSLSLDLRSGCRVVNDDPELTIVDEEAACYPLSIRVE